MKVKLARKILEVNERIALGNKELFKAKGVCVINLMSAPGAGKTTLLYRTIKELKDELRFGVIEGDIQGTHDAEAIGSLDVPVVQINTEGSCHLDANMIAGVLPEFDLDALDILFIENVGNLVCPAEFDVGEDAKAMLLSITEGDDKPLKYPLMFQKSEVLILNKMDLLPYLDVDVEKIKTDAKSLNFRIEILEASSKTGLGLNAWSQWLKSRIKIAKMQ